MRTREPGEDEAAIVCPAPCDICEEPGDCEDCLDCLYWPRRYTDVPPRPVPARGRSAPTKQQELSSARHQLVAGLRVGLLSRRHRRLQGLTQRDLAEAMGWSRSVIGRLEADASGMPLARIEALLGALGYRVAFVPVAADTNEDPDKIWGASDLLARDGQGRRPPPGSRVTWHDEDDRRLYTTLRGREWTWSRGTAPTPPR